MAFANILEDYGIANKVSMILGLQWEMTYLRVDP